MLSRSNARFLLLPRGTQYLLRDDFNVAAVNSTRWQTVDTENKITVGGGAVTWSGGKASPGHGDPMIEAIGPFVRRAGLAVQARVLATNSGAYGPYLMVANALPLSSLASHGEHNIHFDDSTRLNCEYQATGVTPVTLSTGTWYTLRIVLIDTGAFSYYSLDGNVFYILWYEPRGTTSPVYLALYTYSQAGKAGQARVRYGRIPSPRVSATSVASTSPTYGSELLADPGLEANYTAGLCDTLTKNGSPTISQSASVHGGSKAQQFRSLDAGDYLNWGTITPSAATWYLFTEWATRTAGTNGTTFARAMGTPDLYITSASYAQLRRTQRRSTAFGVLPAGDVLNGASDTVVVDDASLTVITPASMLTLIGDPGVKQGLYDLAVTAPTHTQGGQAACVDDETNPTYGLWAWVDQSAGTVNLEKREAGTATLLVSTATGVTYAAARRIRIVITPATGANSNVSVYYESSANALTLVGITQTVDLTNYGTKWCAFGTDASVTFGAATMYGQEAM